MSVDKIQLIKKDAHTAMDLESNHFKLNEESESWLDPSRITVHFIAGERQSEVSNRLGPASKILSDNHFANACRKKIGLRRGELI